jgi:hypothetical protein
MRQCFQFAWVLSFVLTTTATAQDFQRHNATFSQPRATLQAPTEAPTEPLFTVARTPATFRFSLVDGCETLPEDNPGNWSSWSESLYGSDGNYYIGISDHRGVDGQSFVVRLDPESLGQDIVLHTDALLNHEPGTYGHGKLHGRLDEYPKGHLVGATYWGIPPLDTQYKGEFWTGHIPGGYLFDVNFATGQSRDLGCPFPRDSWPMFATDTRRGIFYAIGYDKHFLAYDLANRKTIYAGLPPANIEWWVRATLVDEETGLCFSTSHARFVKFDPATATFSHLPISAPDNPDKDGLEEQSNEMRAYTRSRTPDGSYFCVTSDGMLFKFYPDTETVTPLGKNWGEGYYSTSLALSPDGRYVYYTVDAHGDAYKHGVPVIQYDLETDARKVIAFLGPYFGEKAGYVFGGSYSLTINGDGSELLIVWNGGLRDGEGNQKTFGTPALMFIDIPASERTRS